MIYSEIHPHGIMFHHFHGDGHQPSQGSLSGDEFESVLDWIQERYEILTPEEYQSQMLRGSAKIRSTCLTFDDALASQFSVAVPILRARGLRAFFFVQTAMFDGDLDRLEVHRYFRSTCYSNFSEFFVHFFDAAVKTMGNRVERAVDQLDLGTFLADCPFYTREDKIFRFVRDFVLTENQYKELMEQLMRERDFSTQELSSKLFLTESQVASLAHDGHYIGLHSHSHPFSIQSLTKAQQLEDYATNKARLTDLSGVAPRVVAHPMGRYNSDTLEILIELGVEIGFTASMASTGSSLLEVKREDHANITRKIRLDQLDS